MKRNRIKHSFWDESEIPTKYISTISYDQDEIIQDIMTLYCGGKIDCDPTYSKGVFYKNLPEPKFKFDIKVQAPGVIQADARKIPLRNGYVNSVMFDPPFVTANPINSKEGIIRGRFGYFINMYDLWDFYIHSMTDIYRILADDGIMIFKCQDGIEWRKQYMTHVQVMIDAIQIGFYPKDLFILLAKSRIVSPNQKNQQHARKFHSYFWVFQKVEEQPVKYRLDGIEKYRQAYQEHLKNVSETTNKDNFKL